MSDENKEKKIETTPADDVDVVEFEFNEDGEEDLKKTLKKLRGDLKQVRKEKEEYLTGWQKERADFLNYKKQEEERKASFSEVVRERMIMRFLTVLDSFEMAFANREAWEKVEPGWRKGMEYIHSQIISIFEEFGVNPVGEVGESFDPNIHQSIEVIQTEKKEEDHKVAEIVQRGYKMGERIIRPAGVKVFEHNEAS